MSPILTPSLMQMLRPASPECIDKSTNDRHFVTWTDQEDEILRQAVTTYGFDKWSVIAAQFTNKTSRQCRRRWHTYLLTDCKKGGWSPEEDQLLLEAHHRFGNRWTEIAKMVPGRTDNAVKNRFSALGKKQAKKSSMCNDSSGVAKAVPKRKVLEQNSNIINKRSRADYASFLSCNYNVSQQKHSQLQAEHSLQSWTAEQSMADRAHPVHNDKARKEALFFTTSKSAKVPECPGALPVNRCTSSEGPGILQTPRSFLEKVSPPRLAALTQNAALLDSLVERRNARLKLWGSIDDTWKSFDCFTMEGSGKILQQPANSTFRDGTFGDIRTCLYEGKENYNVYSEIFCESQLFGVVPKSQESVNQHKHPQKLGTATPTIHHERVWKVQSNVERLECSSPSDEVSYQADVTTPLHTDSYSSFLEPPPTGFNEMEQGLACHPQGQGLSSYHQENSEAGAVTPDAVDNQMPSATDLSWDSCFLLDDMPRPQFSDSEKQFLLSALDSSYPTMPESFLLGGNISMASFCI